MSMCVCGHNSTRHGVSTYPVFSQPCETCTKCGEVSRHHGAKSHQFQPCPCANLSKESA